VRADLDRAESTVASFNADLDRISKVREGLNVFQRRMDAGDYDERELTETIVSLQKVLDNNRLYERTRNALVDDLNRMRHMRTTYDYGR
jgi:hypothetical protein